ncbi:hypothetical protein Agabi119p4_2237 [Agaricus bisporus var. burnettii]|uniref:Uncharacterized protein n=1 Tax=Agaricus bisporus var. burnettii TaxID=192524 RepID=A0A8H7F8Q2_AGABI|nr:hypothetical protein Agabi119p4_2237 [Agaricus bisporus var. burnettii]
MSSSQYDSSRLRKRETAPTVHAARCRQSRPVPSHRSIIQLESDVQDLRNARKELDARYSEIQFEIRAVKDRLDERDLRRQELKGITEELNIAQRFLSTADGLSQTEVVRAMESLNEEIFQLTSIVADQLSVKERRIPDSRFAKSILKQSPLLKTMDPYFEIIMSVSLDDPLAIQLGWQTILVQVCFHIISAWEVEDLFCGTGELHNTLQNMYEGIQSENDHAVSGRWRSVVYGATNDISSKGQDAIIDRIVSILADLPVFCGYVFTQEQFDKILTSFRERIDPLFDKCLQVRKMIGKDITSTDIRPYFVEPGRKYDSNLPADLEHEDEKEESLKGQDEIIACSVSLGLYCILESRGDIQSKESIMKPKVILQRTLKEIIS